MWRASSRYFGYAAQIKGKWSTAILGAYCCMIESGATETKYHRQSKRIRR